MEPLPKRIAVLGTGRSGEAVARYIADQRARGADVTASLYDEDAGDEAASRAAVLAAELDMPASVGADAVEGGWDLVVASPGIPPRSRLMRSALASGATVISELEFAWRRSSSPFIAVTGTNGKTTTTALIEHLLAAGGVPAEAVGNIGRPAISVVGETGPASVLVAEVSSFQLALTVGFRPRIAVLLNITPDHVNWHGSLDQYARDKAKVFANMGPGDTAVIDVDDPGSRAWADPAEGAGVRVVRVSIAACHQGGACVRDGVLTLEGPEGPEALIPVSDLGLRGEHNVSNSLAAAAAAYAAGASPAAIREGLATFRPIEHRLEPVGEVDGVAYVNDSKATNPDAVAKALTAFDTEPLIVLLGGRNKGSDFGTLARAVAARCRLAVLFGEALPELRRAFAGLGVPTIEAPGMVEAVALASGAAVEGDVVLLSPACASFDEFRSYEHRGDVFRAVVGALAMAASGPGGTER